MEQDANPVFEACKNGNAEKLNKLLAEGHEYMFRDKNGFSSLYIATKGGHLQCVKLLLQAIEKDSLSAEVVIDKLCNVTFRETPLSIAAEQGHREIVELLATLFSKSTTKPYTGWALNKACENDNIECFNIIRKNVPWLIDAPEFGGYTPLQYAAISGSLHTIKLLVEAGADVSKNTRNAAWALYHACDQGHYLIVKFLLDIGCSVEGYCDSSPLPVAASSYYTETADIVKLLLSKGADPCELVKDYNYMLGDDVEVTPLALAAKQGNLEIVKVLADLTPRSFGPITTFVAAFGNSDKCLQYLFKEGFGTFTSTDIGYSQNDLWHAICWESIEPKQGIFKTGKILLENGTKYNELTISGERFVTKCFFCIDVEVLDLFFQYGLLELQFDCENFYGFDKFSEFTNMAFEDIIDIIQQECDYDELHSEQLKGINKDYIDRTRLFTKYYPFAKFSFMDDSNSANLFDFDTSMILPVVPTLAQLCSWNIRCSIIRKQQRLSSQLVKTLKLPPRLEKLIFS